MAERARRHEQGRSSGARKDRTQRRRAGPATGRAVGRRARVRVLLRLVQRGHQLLLGPGLRERAGRLPYPPLTL